jgi:serine/threonine-protein kinase
MSLSEGTRLGSYEILNLIGAGGMGEVYRARDTKLGRDVAIKVLPEAFSQDKERLARFEREARLLASLNHPNIAAIYDLEESDGVHFLVLELVSGETLAEQIRRGALPLDQVLPIFKQIAEALEAAHEKDIVHRDLKPANIKVTPEDKVKVLDFGLAKACVGESPALDQSESPTMTQYGTQTGVLLGTAPYMSPEQARGKAVDTRTDIWAYGCCLYEALTGRAVFFGETLSDTLAAILEREPDWEALPETTPESLRRLLRRCLRRNARERLHDMADARIEIEEAATAPPEVTDLARSRPSRISGILLALVTTTALIVGLTVGWTMRPSPTRSVTKLRMGLQPAERLGEDLGESIQTTMSRTALSLSPDGRHLVFCADDGEGSRLYLRELEESTAGPIADTEGAVDPFFSPDGEWVGFWAEGILKKVRIEGGPPVHICEAPRPFGASWGSDGSIVFGSQGPIRRVSAEGGEPEVVTNGAEGPVTHRMPQILSDGDTLVFTLKETSFGGGSWDDAKIVAQSLETGEQKVLISDGVDARYAPTGHLVFVRQGSLMAAPFDPESLEITGGAVVVVQDVKQAVNVPGVSFDSGAGQYSFSGSGSLVYAGGGIFPDIKASLVWLDREGRVESLPAPPAPYTHCRLSPDGKRVAVHTMGYENSDIWVYDIPRGTSTRLTLEETVEAFPVWTPDGTRITYASNRSGPFRLFEIPADGSGPAVELLGEIPSQGGPPENRPAAPGNSLPASWSPDGRVLAFFHNGEIWMLPRDGEPKPFLQLPFFVQYPEFSPNGRWLVYTSNQSGRNEVYVTPYPGPGARIQVSIDGGDSPAWARDGREISFWAEGSEGWALMAVDVTTEPSFAVGRPRELFQVEATRYAGAYPLRAHDVASDGQRFLMTTRPSQVEEPVTELLVVLDWFEELKRLAPKN